MIEPLSDVAAGIPWHGDIWSTLNENIVQDRVPQATLLLGARGTGRFILAQRFAAKLLCGAEDSNQKPCGTCRSCIQVNAQTNPGLRVFEPEEPGKQLKVETIRELTAQSTLAVESGQFCIFIVKSAGTMNAAAANALLKTLEEPVPGLVLMLLAESSHQLPATILSRCQKITLPTPAMQVSGPWLTAQDPTMDVAMALRIAHGSPLMALEQANGESLEQYQGLFGSFIDLARGKLSAGQVSEQWVKVTDLDSLLDFLLTWTEELVKIKNSSPVDVDRVLNADPNLKTLSKRIDLSRLFSFRDEILQAKRQKRHNLNSQLVLDHLFIQWMNMSLE